MGGLFKRTKYSRCGRWHPVSMGPRSSTKYRTVAVKLKERRRLRQTRHHDIKGAKIDRQRREEKTIELENRKGKRMKGASCFLVTHCVAWRADRDKWPLVQSQQHQCTSRNEMEMEATCCRGEPQFSQDKAAQTRVCLLQREQRRTCSTRSPAGGRLGAWD